MNGFQLAKVKGDLAELMNNPQSLLLEALHTVGYQGGLAKPLVVPESSLSLITADSLAQFVQVCVSLICFKDVQYCMLPQFIRKSDVCVSAIF